MVKELVRTKKVFFPVPGDMHARLKILAAKQDRNMQSLVQDAVREYLARNEGKK
jgi:predicted transcriptional regulator